MIVVVIIPIPIRMPPLSIFIPPAMRVAIAPLPRRRKISARRSRLRTIPSVPFRRLVQAVIGPRGTVPACILLIRTNSGRPRKQQEAAQRGRSHRSLGKPGQIPLGFHMDWRLLRSASER